MNAHEKERNEMLSKIDEEKIKALKEQPACGLESKFKVGDRIQFKGFGHNKYTIAKVEGNRYVDTSGNGMDMSYTDANFELVKEKPVCEGLEEEYEQIKQKVCSDCPSHKDDYCGYVTRKLQRKCNYLSDVMYGYELGRQSEPRIVFSKEVFDQYDREQFINAYKPKVSEGLEEEIYNYANTIAEGTPLFEIIPQTARHFAQWQMGKDLSSINKSYESGVVFGMNAQKEQMISALKNGGELPTEFIDKFHEIDRTAFQNGQENMKEQMLKDAVNDWSEEDDATIRDLKEILTSTSISRIITPAQESAYLRWLIGLEKRYKRQHDMKAEMMKDAVVCEAEICKLADRVWVTPTDAKKLQQDTYNNFKAGDKVRIIIVKED